MQYKYAKVILLTSGFLSILIEILFYIMQVYEVTDKKISLMYIKGYSKLSKIEKIVWYDPGFSTFHALSLTYIQRHFCTDITLLFSFRLNNDFMGFPVVRWQRICLASWTIHVFIFSLPGKAHVYILWFCLLKPQLHL
ncbi:hypothetical protein BHM03_00031759 [Ensete ventricosum]|nr:hypothetical protein BHM03_00031759 [Ensete ventricosum]